MRIKVVAVVILIVFIEEDMKKMLSVILAIACAPVGAGTVDTSEIEGREMFSVYESDSRELPASAGMKKSAAPSGLLFDMSNVRLLEFPERHRAGETLRAAGG